VPSHLYLSLACLNCRIILRYKPRYRRNAVEVQNSTKEAQYTAASQSQPDTNSTSDAAADDWASDSTDDDDWDFDEDADKHNVSSQKMSALQPMKSAANPERLPIWFGLLLQFM